MLFRSSVTGLENQALSYQRLWELLFCTWSIAKTAPFYGTYRDLIDTLATSAKATTSQLVVHGRVVRFIGEPLRALVVKQKLARVEHGPQDVVDGVARIGLGGQDR